MPGPLVAFLVSLVVLVAGAGMAAWAVAGAVRRNVDSHFAATDAEVRRMADAAFVSERGALDVLHDVSEVRQTLERLRIREEERRERDHETWETLHRVASVLAGAQRAGRAGENVLGEALAHLPPSLLERGFRVNGRVVEFGLVLPDGRRLPIDSKWPAERELLTLAECDDPAERERLTRIVESTVTRRAREVAGYRDPSVTAPVAVAAVPDAAYAVLRRAHVDAYRQGVIVVPYSMALPIVLFLHGLVSRLGEAVDVQACLTDLAAVLDAMEVTLENKLEKASTMLSNGATDLRTQVGKARTAIVRARDPGDGDDEAGADSSRAERPRLTAIPP
jgi:DNA recombination protein RmuC